MTNPRSYRLANLRQYKLRSLFIVATLAATLCWWFRPENDPTGAVVAAYATLIEERINDEPLVLYTSLDDTGVHRLCSQLKTQNVVVRGIADAKQRVPRGVRYVDSSTGLPAWEAWANVERIEPGEAMCKAGYRTGWSCGIGSYLCKKQSGRWGAEEQSFLYGD